jgi:hypothetical protein
MEKSIFSSNPILALSMFLENHYLLVIVKGISSCHNFFSVRGGVFFQVVSLAFNGGGLTRRAPGRRESHRQNELVLVLSFSASQVNPVPPAAGNASR